MYHAGIGLAALVHGSSTIALVRFAGHGIAENLVGPTNLLEALLGMLIPWILVGVVCAGQLIILTRGRVR